MIPFEPGEIAKTTSPLKLFEYFAMEKPVVVTSEMAECIVYDIVEKGHDATSFAEAIQTAYKKKSQPEFIAKSRMLADENSWEERAIEFKQIFEDTNGECK